MFVRCGPVALAVLAALAGADSAKESERAQQLGALQFIAKPFTGDALVAGLSPYLDLRQKAA